MKKDVSIKISKEKGEYHAFSEDNEIEYSNQDKYCVGLRISHEISEKYKSISSLKILNGEGVKKVKLKSLLNKLRILVQIKENMK